jgi:hypothetical protein
MSLFCNSCKSTVGSDQADTLRLRGMCTRCHIQSLPPRSETQVAVPPTEDQHGIADFVAPPPRDVGCAGRRVLVH